MLTVLIHFTFGFCVIAAVAYIHARLLGEINGSFISAGIISGILCASLATFMSQWASLIVVIILCYTAHREYLQSRDYQIKQKEMQKKQEENNTSPEKHA